VRIVNIVAIAKIKGDFDLVLLKDRIKNMEPYIRWLKLRLAPENYYVAFYRSGKFLITGIQDIELIDTIVTRVLEILKQAGIDVQLESITIKNIVLVEKINLDMTLEHLVASLGDTKVSYEPEQFPGLLYKDDYGISYMLFSSGKVILLGVKDIEIARKGIERFKAMVTPPAGSIL
jgi:transcription initiation factor TFIID TATA-box-binding protein